MSKCKTAVRRVTILQNSTKGYSVVSMKLLLRTILPESAIWPVPCSKCRISVLL